LGGQEREISALRIESTTPGVLDGLVQRPATRRRPGPGEVEIRVHAVGLNFRDVLSAMAMYPGDAGPLGGEGAGAVIAVGEGVTGLAVGDDVAGMAFGSFSTHITTPAALLMRRLPGLSHEEMATVPVAFITAWHALHDLARMR